MFHKDVLGIAVVAACLTTLSLPSVAAPLVYVPLGSAGTIVVVDAATDAVVGKFDGLPAVHGLAGTPDGRFLIAGSYQERGAGKEMPVKPAGISEEDHAAHHGGGSAPTQEAESVVSTVSIVRSTDGSAVRRIDVPGAVHHVAVDRDGRWAVVTHPDQGKVSAIDLSSYQVLATIDTGPFPNYAAFSPDGREVYVSNAGNGTVSVIDTRQWTVLTDIAVGSSPEHVVISPDGNKLYVNNVDDGTVSEIAILDRRVVGTIPVGTTLHGIDLAEDGMTLFVAALGDDKVSSIDLATGSRRDVTLSPAPYHLATVRGTGKLYISSSDEPRIWVVDQKTLAVLGQIAIGGKGHQMVIRPGS